MRHEARRHLGELHHQHGADGEVRREEERRRFSRKGYEFLEFLLAQARSAHDAVNAQSERYAEVALDLSRMREVHHDVGIEFADRLGESGVTVHVRAVTSVEAHAHRVWVDACDDLHALGGRDRAHHFAAHLPRGT